VLGWFPLDALLCKGTVIDTRRDAVALKVPVLEFGPCLAPLPDLFFVAVGEFLSETIRPDLAQGNENVGVVVSLVAIRRRRMYRHVGGDALPGELLPHKIRNQPSPLLAGQLVR